MNGRYPPIPPSTNPHASIDLAVAAAQRFRHDTRETDIDLHVRRDLKLTASQWTAVVGDIAEQARLPGRHDDMSNALIMDALLTSPSLRVLATRVDGVLHARTRYTSTQSRKRP